MPLYLAIFSAAQQNLPQTQLIFDNVCSSVTKLQSEQLGTRLQFLRCQNGKGPNRHMHVIAWPAQRVKTSEQQKSIFFYIYLQSHYVTVPKESRGMNDKNSSTGNTLETNEYTHCAFVKKQTTNTVCIRLS